MKIMRDRLTPDVVLPADHANATLIGRAWVPARGGPVPVLVMEDGLHDLSGVAPTADRFGPGQGCTHMVGDVVTVHTPRLGALVNRVNLSNKTEPRTFGIAALISHLTR